MKYPTVSVSIWASLLYCLELSDTLPTGLYAADSKSRVQGNQNLVYTYSTTGSVYVGVDMNKFPSRTPRGRTIRSSP